MRSFLQTQGSPRQFLMTVLAAVVSLSTTAAWPASITLSGAADANISGTAVNTYSPSTYGLVVNAFSNTQAVLDYPLAAIPVNSTINSAQLNFREVAYANANGLVSLSAYGRAGAITSSDVTISATQAASYNSVALGLGDHSVAFDTSTVGLMQSLLGSNRHLGLRLGAASGDTNTSLDSIEQAAVGIKAPTVTASYTVPSNPKLGPVANANITGSTVNRYAPGSYGLVINSSDGTQGVIDYSLAALPAGAAVTAASFEFTESSFTTSSGLVDIYGARRTGVITSSDTTAITTYLGSYDPVALGLGQHSVSLTPQALPLIQSLLGSNQDLGLRFSSSAFANTQIDSLEQYTFAPAPMLALTISVPEPSSLAFVGAFAYVFLIRRKKGRE